MWNTDELDYNEIATKLHEMINSVTNHSNGIHLDGIEGKFSKESLHTWVGIMDTFGRKVLRTAQGIRMMRNELVVTKEHIQKALEIIDNGLRRALMAPPDTYSDEE